MFHKYDKVWDFMRGWGVVENVGKNTRYPFGVTFEDGGQSLYYSEEGCCREYTTRTLFFKEIIIPYDAKNKY